MVEVPRYITWDYDNHVAIEYERLGECNRCGACCEVLIHFKGGADNPNWQGSTGAGPTGCWYELPESGGGRQFFGEIKVTNEPHSCPMFSLTQRRCMVHDENPLFCSTWPLAPEQVAPFPLCSYSFREINRWEFE